MSRLRPVRHAFERALSHRVDDEHGINVMTENIDSNQTFKVSGAPIEAR